MLKIFLIMMQKSIARFNSIGGSDENSSSITNAHLDTFHTLHHKDKMVICCKESDKEKYEKIFKNNDLFVSYHPKGAYKKLREHEQVLVDEKGGKGCFYGIFKKISDVEDVTKEYNIKPSECVYVLQISVERVDKHKPFIRKINDINWGTIISKRGSAGSIKKSIGAINDVNDNIKDNKNWFDILKFFEY